MRRKRSSSASAYENKHNKDVIMSWTRHANAVLFQCFLNAITSANCSLLVSVFVSSARHSVATLNARLQRRYTAVTQTQLFPFIAERKGSEFNHNKDAQFEFLFSLWSVSRWSLFYCSSWLHAPCVETTYTRLLVFVIIVHTNLLL